MVSLNSCSCIRLNICGQCCNSGGISCMPLNNHSWSTHSHFFNFLLSLLTIRWFTRSVTPSIPSLLECISKAQSMRDVLLNQRVSCWAFCGCAVAKVIPVGNSLLNKLCTDRTMSMLSRVCKWLYKTTANWNSFFATNRAHLPNYHNRVASQLIASRQHVRSRLD